MAKLTSVEIRNATAADIPALQALASSAEAAAQWGEAAYQRTLAPGSDRMVLVGDDGAIQGFIVARDLGPEWEIENIVVAAPAQRQGLGSRLLVAVLEQARQGGANAVFLEVRESNQAARALYEKWGLKESGRRKSYYRNPEEDALIYKKILSADVREGC